MKKFLFLGACLVALASQPATSQVTEKEVIIVQATATGGGDGFIAITRGAGKVENVSFKTFNKKFPEESVAYQQVITKLYQEGYSLKSTFSTSSNSVTMVFVKGE
jgi:hypothetical protein